MDPDRAVAVEVTASAAAVLRAAASGRAADRPVPEDPLDQVDQAAVPVAAAGQLVVAAAVVAAAVVGVDSAVAR